MKATDSTTLPYPGSDSAADLTERVLLGLIGRGIQASRSPKMHETEADAQGLRLVYALFDFAELGLEREDLPQMLAAAELLGFAGINVTHPYKQAIIRHLDALSDKAEQVGAVNTVEFRGGRRIGHNTDVTGFANAFRYELAGVAMNHVVQVGAGGGGAPPPQELVDLGVQKQDIQ
jgi:shikimate dehydrogenase